MTDTASTPPSASLDQSLRHRHEHELLAELRRVQAASRLETVISSLGRDAEGRDPRDHVQELIALCRRFETDDGAEPKSAPTRSTPTVSSAELDRDMRVFSSQRGAGRATSAGRSPWTLGYYLPGDSQETRQLSSAFHAIVNECNALVPRVHVGALVDIYGGGARSAGSQFFYDPERSSAEERKFGQIQL